MPPTKDSEEAAESEDFDTYFDKLLAFKKRNGHTKVPKHYSEDMKLALWVAETRKHFKFLAGAKTDEEREQMSRDFNLTPEQIQKLKDLDFELSNKNPRHMRWEFRYQQLKEFVEQYGHTQVPIGWPENVKLANWVSTQRQEYKNMRRGRTSQLNESRIKLLNDLNFAWEVQRGGRRRQLASTPSSGDTAQANRKADGADATSILPGKALIVGNGLAQVSPARKKGKASPGGNGMPQMSPQFPFGMMPQQQAFFSPGDAQGGFPGMNMGMPQWHMPPGVMSNPAMNYQTHLAQQIMFAKSNNTNSRTRSDPPSDPPMMAFGPGNPMMFPNPQMQAMVAAQQEEQQRRGRSDPPSAEAPQMAEAGQKDPALNNPSNSNQQEVSAGQMKPEEPIKVEGDSNPEMLANGGDSKDEQDGSN